MKKLKNAQNIQTRN